ncbi:uncharacterized protein LOC106172683 [Lingula anatina]|uniref:Uncharacterized protein LOC106172683 n=1 Tax=Lingula anatina TaxID=7574 RepID=A0A2R2MKV1_LINAN|nr:uncharacterized protein LOC106172683 [Lingula anatina]|eukprot:XP_023930851.1 uncharacterized protein LOC106172683 [Lingula anatina]
MKLAFCLFALIFFVALMPQDGESWRLRRVWRRAVRVVRRVVRVVKTYKAIKAAVAVAGDENNSKFMLNDLDGDGKISLHDVKDPEAMEELDTNEDGYVDQEELDNFQTKVNLLGERLNHDIFADTEDAESNQLDNELDGMSEEELAELQDLLNNKA